MMVSRSNIHDRLHYAEWVVQFSENWAAQSTGSIKRNSRVTSINELRRMVIAYCYWEIGLNQSQTGAVVNRKHPAIHHQLRVHNEAHQTAGNTNRQTDPNYCRNYKLYVSDIERESRETSIEYVKAEIERLQLQLNELNKKP
jgi:hypothetical protein